MHEHPLILICLALMAIATAIAATIATRVQVPPDVIDLTLIPTGSVVARLTLVIYGATRRLNPSGSAACHSRERLSAAAAPRPTS